MQHDEVKIAQATLKMVDIGARILARRVLTFIALLFTAGGFIAALALSTWISLTAACIFTVLVFLPILWADGREAG